MAYDVDDTEKLRAPPHPPLVASMGLWLWLLACCFVSVVAAVVVVSCGRCC